MRIQVLSSLLTMIGFVHGAAVVWPDGYTPTVEERNSAIAEAERREIAAPALGQRSSSDSSLVEPRGLLSKCLQAHCGFESQILLNDVIQFTVWFGDGYIFNLAGGSANIADASTTFTWSVHDNEGRSWAFRSTGWCRKFEALSQHGWISLHQKGWQHTSDDCPPCGGKGDGHCATCQYAEAVFYWDYDDKDQCARQGIVGNCDYAGSCTKLTRGVTMMCNPGTDQCRLYK